MADASRRGSESTETPPFDGYEPHEEFATPTAPPTGLDLHPKPQGAVRVKKSIGVTVALGGFVLVFVIAISIMKHKGVAPTGTAKPHPTTSALAAGDQEAAKQQEMALKAANGGDVGDELGVQPPLKVTPRGETAQANGIGQYRGPNGGNPPAGGPPPLSPEEQAYEDEIKAEKAAVNAPMSARSQGGGGFFPGAASQSAGSSPVLDALRAEAATLGQRPGAGPGGPTGSDDQNKQNDKESFLEKAKGRPDAGYLKATRVAAISPYEIKAGWDIPAVLEQAINSDLPGEVRGLVRENVYDTKTGRCLLIPQGSRVIGTYNHRIAYGQNGIQVIWTRLIYPDGSSISLDGMVGEDARGQSGFRDQVDNHYKRLIGFALLTSAFSAGIALSQNTNQYSTTGIPTNSQVVTQALGQQLGELGITITQKNLNIQPTIMVRVGYRFNVRVDRDIAFEAPYAPY
jgi:type IV secretory pathway VirB10-like protein